MKVLFGILFFDKNEIIQKKSKNFKKGLDKSKLFWYNIQVVRHCWYGSVGRARHW